MKSTVPKISGRWLDNPTPIYDAVVAEMGDIPNKRVESEKRTHAQAKHDKSRAWKMTNEVWRRINGGK